MVWHLERIKSVEYWELACRRVEMTGVVWVGEGRFGESV